jgi:hypothetical protein
MKLRPDAVVIELDKDRLFRLLRAEQSPLPAAAAAARVATTADALKVVLGGQLFPTAVGLGYECVGAVLGSNPVGGGVCLCACVLVLVLLRYTELQQVSPTSLQRYFAVSQNTFS